MQKDYEIKLYTLAGVLLKTIPRSLIKSEISFSTSINSWPSELKVLLNVDFGYTDIEKNNVIRVYEYEDEYPDGRNIYTGIIQRVKRSMTSGVQSVEFSAIGIQVLLTHLYYYDAGYTFTATDEPRDIVQAIIDYINTQYPAGWLTYDVASLETYGSNISLDIAYDYCNDVLKEIIKATNWYFVVDGTGKLFFKQKPTTSSLDITFERDIDEIMLEEDGEKVVNRYILKWKSGTLAAVNDVPSQTANGIREFYDQRAQIADVSTATAFAANYLIDNAYDKKKTRIVLNTNIDLESILPWQALKVLNVDYPIEDIIIQKVSYTSQKCTIEVDTIRNFILELNS